MDLPFYWRWLIRAGSWIVPGPARQTWRRRGKTRSASISALLRERGERRGASRLKIFQYCRGAFAGAAHERFPAGDMRPRLQRAARGPGFLFSWQGLFLLSVVLGTGLFSGLRALYSRLPYRDPDRLVACYQVHFLSASWGYRPGISVRGRAAAKRLWIWLRMKCGCFAWSGPAPWKENVDGALVTPGFFGLLGVQPEGGWARPLPSFAGETPVLLSHDFWQRRFGSDSRVTGAKITVDGKACRVAGVLPAHFWFRSRKLAVWVLAPDLVRPSTQPRLVGAIGRLRLGATAPEARAELEGIAWRASRFRGGALRVVPLAQSLRPALGFVLTGLAGGVLLAAGIALIQFWRSYRRRRDELAELLRYWSFFTVKTFFMLVVLALLCAETASRNALGVHPSKIFLGLFIDWASILGALLIFRWSILDQSRRCPVCLRRLAMPVASGSWGSSLLAPPSTELLCDKGHGSLLVDDSHTAFGEVRRWIALDDSWRELFTADTR